MTPVPFYALRFVKLYPDDDLPDENFDPVNSMTFDENLDDPTDNKDQKENINTETSETPTATKVAEIAKKLGFKEDVDDDTVLEFIKSLGISTKQELMNYMKNVKSPAEYYRGEYLTRKTALDGERARLLQVARGVNKLTNSRVEATLAKIGYATIPKKPDTVNMTDEEWTREYLKQKAIREADPEYIEAKRLKEEAAANREKAAEQARTEHVNKLEAAYDEAVKEFGFTIADKGMEKFNDKFFGMQLYGRLMFEASQGNNITPEMVKLFAKEIRADYDTMGPGFAKYLLAQERNRVTPRQTNINNTSSAKDTGSSDSPYYGGKSRAEVENELHQRWFGS